MKKIISMLLVVIITISMATSAYAADTDALYFLEDKNEMIDLPELDINYKTLSQSNDYVVRSNCTRIVQEARKIENMNIVEVNAYIDSIINKNGVGASYPYRNTNSYMANKVGVSYATANPAVTVVELKALWLAAAQAAKIKGYTCSAKLIEYSVLGIDYNETKGKGGLFHDKIVKTKPYTNLLSDIKNNKRKTGKYGIAIENSDNSDLYYSLHKCTCNITKSGTKYKTVISDTYDFALMSNYDSAFTSAVNNWAWLCQNMYVLNVINVNISWTE